MRMGITFSVEMVGYKVGDRETGDVSMWGNGAEALARMTGETDWPTRATLANVVGCVRFKQSDRCCAENGTPTVKAHSASPEDTRFRSKIESKVESSTLTVLPFKCLRKSRLPSHSERVGLTKFTFKNILCLEQRFIIYISRGGAYRWQPCSPLKTHSTAYLYMKM